MTEGTPTKRLSKVAREFNIGLTTIVDFLNKKGISVENNPNAKISQDAYELLFQEFQSEKTLKEATRKAGLSILKRESVSMDKKEAKDDEAVQEADGDDELLIHDRKGVVKEKPAAKEEAPVSAEKPAVPKAPVQPDVDEPAPEKAEATEDEKTADEEERLAAETEEKEAQKADSKIRVVGKIALEETGKKKKAVKKAKEDAPEKEQPKKDEAPDAVEAPAAATDPEKDSPVQAADQEKTDIPEDLELSKIPQPSSTEHHQTQYQKLEGPVILGKMELPEPREEAKKPVASSTDETKSKKRKRKRIRKEKSVEVEVESQDKKSAKAKKAKKKETPRPEVSEEEISRQIRETLANLSGTGKSKAAKHRRLKREMLQQQKEKELEQAVTDQRKLQVTEFVSAAELAKMMNVSVNEIISTCMSLGLFVSINQRLDAETIAIVADEFGFEVSFVSADTQETIEEVQDDPSQMHDRAPIVTVMGHVDHGKTSLLDQIRHSNIIAGEAGGITQHIGAYAVELDDGKRITFLDTPGHEAFTAMRARGAKVTDVAIIVVAADDSVMPQTVEAINHAQAANVPIVIAINKIDKENAAPEKVKQELASMNILVEDWGGKYQSQEISAKAGQNIDSLLEKVLLEAELLELKANPSRLASGTVIESSLDKGRGYVATILVQNGTLRVGDIVVAGTTHGKVKAMFNERGQRVKEAGPSTPILILGLDGAPLAGDTFHVMATESEAKSITTKRQQLIREQGLRTQKHITLDEIGRRIAIGDFKELNIIVKGDVDGSVEALSDSLLKLSTEEIQVNIIHKAVGQITEGDVLLASASNAIIIGFQVRPSMSARKLAEQEQIDIRLYSVIYNAINEITSAIEGMLSPEIEEKVVANLEVRDVFKITKVGTVAGCMVLDGKIRRNASIRLIRDGIVVFTGELGSLKRFKEDVKEVASGYECGLNIERFNDIKVGDIIEAFETIEIARKLE
ncbi:MAG: translation initiation factor IF-2 [Bacteroidales bacterium]|nr:translation initiation factor IF-2 [Bacteroidales bacterium]